MLQPSIWMVHCVNSIIFRHILQNGALVIHTVPKKEDKSSYITVMKLPGKSLNDDGGCSNLNPTSSVTLDKQTAVGAPGVNLFDSGCNLSGLRKVHIYCGRFHNNRIDFRSTIKRLFLEFDKPSNSSTIREPSYNGIGMFIQSGDVENILELNPNDSIVRIDVWTNNILVNGIQFFMKSGAVSELYGVPNIKPPITFQGKQPGSKLVGIHGCFGGVVYKLGFTFATTSTVDHDFPPSSSIDIDSTWATLSGGVESTAGASKEKEEDASWTKLIEEKD